MSFAPPTQTKMGGIDGRNIATTQEGIPLPWFCGIRRLKANWITPAWARRTRDKGRKEGEHWYCNITAAFGMGPAQAMVGMFYNGKYNNYQFFDGATPIDSLDHPQYYNIPPGYLGLNSEFHWEGCAGRIHWGLDPQPVDEQNPAASYPLLFGNDNSNPRYWRVILVEWRQLFIGLRNPSQMPNIEAVFVRAPQIPAGWTMDTTIPYWLSGSPPSIRNYTHGVNPVAALVELLTNKHTGFARDPDDLDQSTWEAIADEVSADKYRVNPLYDQFATEDQIREDFLKYFDGYTYYRNGKLALGRRPDEITVLVPSNYTELTSHDFTRPPKLKTTRPDETINEVEATWTDPQNMQYKEVSRIWDAPHNREARGEPVRENLDLGWKQIEADVDSYVKKFLGHAAAVRQTGSVFVRENRCVNPDSSPIQVGDIIFLDQSVPQLDHAFRVIDAKEPEDGEIELKVETERGQYPLAYVAPAELEPNDELPDVDSVALLRVLELPYEISGVTGQLTIFPLLTRASGEVNSAVLHFKDSEDAYHAVGTYSAGQFCSTASRISATTADEEGVRELTVSGAGDAAANGLYTQTTDVGGHKAWVNGNGWKIQYKDVTNPWVIIDDLAADRYQTSSTDLAGPWTETGSGTAPAPTVEPDLWLIWASALDDRESIIATQTKGEAENNTLLMIQGEEIFSVELVLLDELSSDYKIFARRQRLGSLREDHGTSGQLIFVLRSSITYLGHEFIKFGETITYKLQPRNWAQAAKMEDLTPGTFQISSESSWIPQITVNAPAHSNNILGGNPIIGDDIEWDVTVTAPRGPNLHASLAGYRYGAQQTNDPVQDTVKVWDRPTQTNFKAIVELPILDWYAMTFFVSNNYGTSSFTIWANVNTVQLPQGLIATGASNRIDLSWQNADLPDRMVYQYFPQGDYPKQKIGEIKADAIANLSHRIENVPEGTYQVYVWAYKYADGKEWISDPPFADTDVPVGKYPQVPALGGATILTSPNGYEFILYIDGAAVEAAVGSDGWVEYRWWYTAEGPDTGKHGYFPAGWNQFHQEVPKEGAITLWLWMTDKDGNKGTVSSHTTTIMAHAEPKAQSVSKPEKYRLRVFYDPATAQKYIHCWGWPNYTNGFVEARWAPWVEAKPSPDNYIDFECIRSNEYRLSLYTQDEEERWSPDPVTLMPNGGVVYATPDAHAAPSQLGGAPIISTPNPKEFIIYHDGSLWEAGKFFVVYRWWKTSDPEVGGSNWFPAEWNQMNQSVEFTGGITVQYWIEDRDQRKGIVTDQADTIDDWQAPGVATNFAANGQRGKVVITWVDPTLTPSTQGEIDRVEILRQSGSTYQVVGSVDAGVQTFDDQPAGNAGLSYAYKVRVVTKAGKTSTTVGIAGVQMSNPAPHTNVQLGMKRVAFSDDVVNDTGDELEILAHGFRDNEEVIILKDGTATMPGGLTEGETYVVEYVSSGAFQLRNKTTGQVIDITSSGSGNFHIFSRELTITWTESADAYIMNTDWRIPNGASTYRRELAPKGTTSIKVDDWYPLFSVLLGGYYWNYTLQDSWGIKYSVEGGDNP